MAKKIYLAGPISGLTYDEAQKWRNTVADSLAPEIECYSPLRQKSYLRNKGVLEQSYQENALSTDRGIMTRDHWDVKTSDLVFVNLLDVSRVSIGTIMEIAWAFAYRVPLVLVADYEGVHEHPMIREAVGFRAKSLADGMSITRAILTARVAPHRYQVPNNQEVR